MCVCVWMSVGDERASELGKRRNQIVKRKLLLQAKKFLATRIDASRSSVDKARSVAVIFIARFSAEYGNHF